MQEKETSATIFVQVVWTHIFRYNGIQRKYFDASVIARAISMVATKMSPDEARRQLANEGITVDTSTIARWASHYSDIMCKFSAMLRVDAGFQWHVDELFFKILKNPRYFFAIMDGASRFILSYEISPDKQGVNPTRLFTAAAKCTLRLPRILVSDGLHDFCKPAKKVFRRLAGPRFVHIREVHLKNIFNQNNVFERFNGELKDRLKCTRGFKSEDPTIPRLFIIYHNFFREHTGLKNNMTPVQAIGIDIVPTSNSDSTPGYEQWITFIQNAAISTAA